MRTGNVLLGACVHSNFCETWFLGGSSLHLDHLIAYRMANHEVAI